MRRHASAATVVLAMLTLGAPDVLGAKGYEDPAPPSRGEVFKGRSGQGKAATLTTDDKGAVKKFEIVWRADCRDPGTFFRNGTLFRPRHSTSDAFSQRGRYVLHDSGYRLEVHVASRGRRFSEVGWKGRFSASVRVERGGMLVNRCRLGGIRWRATNDVATVTMQSDDGDYIGGGGDFAYADPPENITAAGGDPGLLIVRAGGWSLEFIAPRGRSLRPGHYAGATRIGGNGAGMSVSGHGRGCGEVQGEFTVHSARFRDGDPEAIHISFVHHCEGAPPALRGEIDYRGG